MWSRHFVFETLNTLIVLYIYSLLAQQGFFRAILLRKEILNLPLKPVQTIQRIDMAPATLIWYSFCVLSVVMARVAITNTRNIQD